GCQFQRLGLAQRGLDEALEQLHVQGRGGVRFGVPLDADTEPVRIDRFDRLDNAIRGQRADAQTRARLAHGLMVRTVDADFTPAVDLVEAGVWLQQHGVPVRSVAG